MYSKNNMLCACIENSKMKISLDVFLMTIAFLINNLIP